VSGTVLVTGATGKTGTELIAVLRRQGLEFVGGVRRIVPERGYPQVVFDWDDPGGWAAALLGVESLYLVKPHRDPGPAITSLLAHAPFLRRVVLLSELGREAKPASDPERAAERALENSAVPWTILRPSWFFQNFNGVGGYGEPIRTRGELQLPSGRGRFSLVDTRDVAEAAFVALTTDDHQGLGVPLTGPEAFTMAGVADAISAAAGRRVEHRSAGLADYRAQLVARGVASARVEYLMDLNTDAAEGRFATVTDGVERMTGHAPRTLAEFVAENADYWSAGDVR
jgi:uncharacterized protein YbjT (DUF2867 family)